MLKLMLVSPLYENHLPPLFIHVSKTSGESVEAALKSGKIITMQLSEYPKGRRGSMKPFFIILRNHWDRIVSW